MLRLLLTRWLAPAALRRESDDEREGEGENEARVTGGSADPVVLFALDARSAVGWARTVEI